MKRYLQILFLLLIGLCANSQSPTGLPSPSSPTSYYNIGWLKSDSGIINVLRDTTVRSRFAGLQIFWVNPGVDSNAWFFDGTRYFHYLKTGQDVINALGYTPAPAFALTTNNTSGPATYLNNVLNIPQYTGGGSGGIGTLNGLTAATQTFATGTAGSDFNIVSSTSTHTFNFPTASASNRGLLSTSDWATFNSKQPQLNGTGFVKASGTSISYDNSTYYLSSNPNSYIPLTSISALTPILYNNSTGVISADTSTGLTHLATQAFVFANQASGTITGSGNLSPLFTTSISSNTIIFSLSNAAANTALTNSTGSSGVPSYGKINNSTLSNSSITFSSTDLSGSASISLGATLTSNINSNAVTYSKFQQVAASSLVGNPTGSTANAQGIQLGVGLAFVGGKLAVDTANFKDTINLRNLGSSGDSLAYIIGGTTLGIRKINFSTGLAVTHNSDSSLTITSSGGTCSTCYSTSTSLNDSTFTLNRGNGTKDTIVISGTGGAGSLATASGDASGTVSGTNLPLTLATVNSNVGTFGDATHVAQVTLNGKGLVTAGSSVAITGLITTLTTTGTSGPATYSAGTLNIPQYSGGGGVAVDVVTTITSGTSSTVPNGTNILQFNNSTNLTYSLTEPTTWHNSNNLIIALTGTGTVTLTIVNGSGQTLSQSINPNGTTFSPGEILQYHLIGSIDQRIN